MGLSEVGVGKCVWGVTFAGVFFFGCDGLMLLF